MLLLLPVALAETYDDDFSADAGRWTGGAVDGGVLRVESDAALSLGELTALDGSLKVRLASGSRMALVAGEARWEADYTVDGGVRLGGDAIPLPTGHYTWVADPDPVIEPGTDGWDAGHALHCEVFYDADTGTWFLYWTGELAPPSYGYRQIGLATSPDGVTWTRYAGNPVLTIDGDRTTVDGIHVHMPTVVKQDGTWHMYYACYQNNVGNRICHATSADGYSWTKAGVAVDKGGPGEFDEGSLREPDVIVGPDGTWHMLYNGTDPEQHYGPTGYATSPDGYTWTKHAPITDGESQLQGGGMFDGPYGVEQWWNCGDKICHSTAQWDDFTSWVDDDAVSLHKAFADWSDGYLQGASPWLVGATWHMWFNAYSYDGDARERIGHARTVPVPGAWVELSLAWDGATLTVRQNGATQSVALASLDGLRVEVEGVAEVDDVALSWTVAPVDTGGDTDTDAGDDTATDTDTADTDVPVDTADTSIPTDPNRDEGCGCVSAGPAGSAAGLAALGLLFAARRRRAPGGPGGPRPPGGGVAGAEPPPHEPQPATR